MSKFVQIAITVIVFLIIDFYAYQAIRKSTSKRKGLKTFRISYWLLSFLFYLLFLGYFGGYLSTPTANTRNLFGGIFMVFLAMKVFIIPFLILDDLRRFAIWITQKVKGSKKTNKAIEGKKISRSEFITKMALFVGSIPVFGLGWGIINGAYNYRVHKLVLRFPNLPQAFNGTKIVQISDIHSGSLANKEAVEKGIKLINELNADYVFFTGDLVNNETSEFDAWFNVFNKIKANEAIFSTLGNHDYGLYRKWDTEADRLQNVEAMVNTHKKLGWDLLLNEHRILTKEDASIAIIGVENWGKNKRFPRYGKLGKAFQGTENIPFKLLLSHDPSHWDAQIIPKYPSIDLTLSGHTHGMQLGIEIPGKFKWSPAKYAYKQWAGLYSNEKQYLYVNRGFGFIGYPGRLGILPEITFIELQKA